MKECYKPLSLFNIATTKWESQDRKRECVVDGLTAEVQRARLQNNARNVKTWIRMNRIAHFTHHLNQRETNSNYLYTT